MTFAIVFAFALVVVTFSFHYKVLIWLGQRVPNVNIAMQSRVLFIVLVLFLAHIIEIAFYAGAYAVSVLWLNLGAFHGAEVNDLMSYLYYSGVIYTSLGLGDIYPEGHIRFITAMETLNGFLLITWSASFTCLAMGRLWPVWSDCNDPESHSKSA